MKILRTCIIATAIAGASFIARSETLKVLQMNLWMQGTNITDGESAIIDVIDSSDPDIVLLCETVGPRSQFLPFLCTELAERGKTYYCDTLDQSMGIMSKYRIEDCDSCFRLDDNSRPLPVCKAGIRVGDRRVAFYSIHLDWTHYECYMPRGYSGTTWKKLPSPVSDADSVLEANRISFREEGIANIIKDAAAETAANSIVILGGDFNEPSHLDWQQDTRNIRDHNGLIVNWDCSMMLQQAGYIDTFRQHYPDAVKNPGFTFPAGNTDTELKKLVWVPDKDERDRIDFIYYHPDPRIELKSVSILGPAKDIICGEIAESTPHDPIITPVTPWPTDHKAILTTFHLK